MDSEIVVKSIRESDGVLSRLTEMDNEISEMFNGIKTEDTEESKKRYNKVSNYVIRSTTNTAVADIKEGNDLSICDSKSTKATSQPQQRPLR
jgi:hypothetical protein